MPHLYGLQNIQDFIACVAVAILRSYLYASEVPKLLYAAQIATATLPRQPAQKSRPATASGEKKLAVLGTGGWHFSGCGNSL
ncbi:MAG: hypothetical protein ACRD5L_08580, partial [Bryobacteraceae bacterium]